jgi:hypothetical protein
MKNSSLGLSLLVSMGVLMAACGDSGSSCASGQVNCDGMCIAESDATLAWVQANVFDVHGCAASSVCHNGMNPNTLENLNLSNASSSFDSLVDAVSSQASPQVLVEPSESDSSYLMNKLLGEGMANGTQLMPQGATTPLCAAKLDGVRAWIDAGANP